MDTSKDFNPPLGSIEFGEGAERLRKYVSLLGIDQYKVRVWNNRVEYVGGLDKIIMFIWYKDIDQMDFHELAEVIPEPTPGELLKFIKRMAEYREFQEHPVVLLTVGMADETQQLQQMGSEMAQMRQTAIIFLTALLEPNGDAEKIQHMLKTAATPGPLRDMLKKVGNDQHISTLIKLQDWLKDYGKAHAAYVRDQKLCGGGG